MSHTESSGRRPVAVVTGASGFVGKRLCEKLIDAGYEVRGLVAQETDASFLEGLGVALYRGRMRDADVVAAMMVGARVVFHLAGIVGRVGKLDAVYWDVNVTATKELLKAATAAGVARFVHCSTADVHGDIVTPPADEEAPLAGQDIYQVTKEHAERAVLASNGRGSLTTVVIRPSVVYGPRDLRRYPMFRAIAKQAYIIIGDGTTTIHPLYIDDLVDGLLLAAVSGKAAGRVYLLAGERVVTHTGLATMVAAELKVPPSFIYRPAGPARFLSMVVEKLFFLFGMEPPLFRRTIEFFTKNRAYDIRRAVTELGFAPKVTLEEGIHRTVAWYRERGLL
ncbi:MAG: NAD-dependent epimerase/dehydratase family protein [Nitrospinae bacterium]|nr:NAD-dependent epimerase/dehydratase family protein [Nitrospinota bacterium]